MTETSLQKLRASISALDQELLKIFAKRRQLSIEVAKTKLENNYEIRDHQQERHLLANLTEQGVAIGIPPNTTLSLFHNIIEDSVRAQYDYYLEHQNRISKSSITVALLGEPESYSHIAAQNHFSSKAPQLKAFHCSSFLDIFKKVNQGEVEAGLIPIENTTSGNITEVFDLLLEYDLKIIGEEKLKVKHCLIGTQQATLEGIKDVYSHPQAISQCKRFFAENPKINSHFRSSTSSALKMVAEYQNPSIAAIASELAAQKSGLKILKFGINNYLENYTRFILISKNIISVPGNVPAKTTIIIHTEQKTGALSECLQVLKRHHINLSKLESRPIATKPWQEMFYIDFEGNKESPQVVQALTELENIAQYIQVLGCYPKHDILATKLDGNHLKHQLHQSDKA